MFDEITEIIARDILATNTGYQTEKKEDYAVYQKGEKKIVFERCCTLEEALVRKFPENTFISYKLNGENMDVYIPNLKKLISIRLKDLEIGEVKIYFYNVLENEGLYKIFKLSVKGELESIGNIFYQLVKEMKEYRLQFQMNHVEVNS